MSGHSNGGEVVLLVLSWLVTTALTYVVVLLDERWMSEGKLERAWPPSSRDAAIVAFGLLALPVHFVRTRMNLRSARGVLGSLLGLLMGVVAFVAVALVAELVLDGLAHIFGLPTD